MAFNRTSPSAKRFNKGKSSFKSFKKGGKTGKAEGNFVSLGALWNDENYGPSVSLNVHKKQEYKGKVIKPKGRILFEDAVTGKIYLVKYIKARFSDTFNEVMDENGVDVGGSFQQVPLVQLSLNLDNENALEEIDLGTSSKKTSKASTRDEDEDEDEDDTDASSEDSEDDEDYEA